MVKNALKIFFILLGFSIIAVWISNNYGTVDIFWLGYSVHTSVPVLLFIMWIVFVIVDKIMWGIGKILKPFKKKKVVKTEKSTEISGWNKNT